jgi:transposase InsO family protein
MCAVVGISSRGLRAFRSRPASRRQWSDLITLAHIKEQSRLSLGSYGRPRMTEELKEIGLDVGHRRVGRLMRQNGISVVRTRKYKVTTIARQAIAKQSAERGIAITSSISRRTCWIVTSTQMPPTKSGRAISVTFGRVRVGCIWRSSWICTQGVSLDGLSATA